MSHAAVLGMLSRLPSRRLSSLSVPRAILDAVDASCGDVPSSGVLELDSMLARPRRNRRSSAIRGYSKDTWIAPQHLVYPIFVHDGGGPRQPVASMPGQARLGAADLVEEVGMARDEGVNSVVLFPAIDASLKTRAAVEAANPHGLIPTLIRRLKDAYPDLTIITDVALDPYNSDGHDGIVSDCGSIANDLTVRVLCQQALEQARAGADIIAPSDMMDGRVAAIRATLDAHGFAESVSVLSYTAKYASAFYGPFRDALDSAPASGSDSGRIIPATKQTYQMDPANWREAMREVDLDVAEGADMLMVKPAGPYLDIIQRVSCATDLPVAAYQVSGEYAMIKAASMNGWLDEDQAVMESLTAIRRAGADVVFTYYARHAARLLA